MNKSEFKQRLSNIKSATSVSGKKYSSIRVFGDSIEFMRENKTKSESISITELHQLFTIENSISTSIAKLYISGRVQSPAVAIINELKSNPNFPSKKIITDYIDNSIVENKKQKKSIDNIKDETRFFIAFSELIGKDYLISKSIGKPVSSSHLFLSKNFENYNFNKKIKDCYLNILIDLKSNKQFDSDSLSHHIDGIISNHPILKNRIIEFDEEQHFTPARLDTINNLREILPNNYFSKFYLICKDLNYLNDHVLKKHRIKNKLKNIPKSFIEFVDWLEQSNEKSSGYISNKKGFDFLGGRIAQRAYYDCLRDTAHLSNMNDNFESPLRFSKKTFEDTEKIDFKLIKSNRIKEIIIEILKKDYDIRISNT